MMAVTPFGRFVTGSEYCPSYSSDLCVVLWRLPFVVMAAIGVANSIPYDVFFAKHSSMW
jgi:hypothetical protein